MQTSCQEKQSLLDQVTASLDDQPMALGNVAQAVIRLIGDPEVSVSRLSRAIAADTGISGRIIRKANSAFYGGSSRVTSLPLAIVKLGFPSTRSLTIAGSVQAMFREGDSEGFEQYLWRHSLAVGIASRSVMRRVTPGLAEEAYLAGLLHDIAKLILLQRFPAIYKPVLSASLSSGKSQLDVELTRMGFTHADLGAMILDRWNFAEADIRAVRFHHDPDRAGSTLPDPTTESDATHLAHCVCLADAIVKNAEGEFYSAFDANLSDHPSVGFLSLSPDDLSRIREQLSTELGDELQVFGESRTRKF